MVDVPLSGSGAAARPLDVGDYLFAAHTAVAYVKRHLKLGAANKGWDWLVHRTGLYETAAGTCLAAVRKDYAAYKAQQNRSKLELIQFMAKRAIAGGCGNCDQQAMIAFELLRESRIFPIDLMYITDKGGEPVHIFVLIGRDKTGAPDNPKQWGNHAVICDPWDDSAYHGLWAKDFLPCYEKGSKIASWFRMD